MKAFKIILTVYLLTVPFTSSVCSTGPLSNFSCTQEQLRFKIDGVEENDIINLYFLPDLPPTVYGSSCNYAVMLTDTAFNQTDFFKHPNFYLQTTYYTLQYEPNTYWSCKVEISMSRPELASLNPVNFVFVKIERTFVISELHDFCSQQ